MKEFIRKHDARIHCALSCFDRMLFRGYLPIMSGWEMAQFLDGLSLNCSNLRPFLLKNAYVLPQTSLGKKGAPSEPG